jgi:hypothetical protein
MIELLYYNRFASQLRNEKKAKHLDPLNRAVVLRSQPENSGIPYRIPVT